MPLQPGFVDEPPPSAKPATPPDGPLLLDAAEDSGRGPIDHAWEPEAFGKRPTGWNSSTMLAAGLALLIVGWVVLSGIGFVLDQFRRSGGLGALTLVVLGSALSMIIPAARVEVKSYRALRRVEALRAALARADTTAADAKELCEPWAHTICARLPEPDLALDALRKASTISEVKAVLRDRIVEPLRQTAQQAGRRAAVQGGAIVAITPSPTLDGVLAGLRALALIRGVARIYGLRPGPAVTFALLRRIAWTVASVSGIELLSRSLTDHTLEGLPVIRHLAGAVPGTSLTAIRLYRLANIAAEACSPLPD
jgi:putative membrane protein